MKKHIKIILILVLFFACTSNVFAAAEITSRTYIKIDEKTVYKLYDNVAENGDVNHIGSYALKIIINIDGNVYAGYCIDMGMTLSTGNVNNIQTLYEYFKNVLSDSEAKELVKKLTLYTKFGYGYNNRTTDKYYLATQQLIWQAISDTGFYQSDFYYEQTNGKVSKLKIANFRWTNDGGKTTIDVSSELNSIQNSIDTYYTKPSFCSSQNKLELEVGKTEEYIDTNNVLQSYIATCDVGLTCKTDGNKLSVTAIDSAGNRTITFDKTPSGTENKVYRITGKQGIIVQEGTLEPISCEFGIDTFTNEETSGIKIAHTLIIALFSGIVAYFAYYIKKSINELN